MSVLKKNHKGETYIYSEHKIEETETKNPNWKSHQQVLQSSKCYNLIGMRSDEIIIKSNKHVY